ncbi:hypothetical protein SynA15127_01493 [Synechococcus sp. A15-127]|nr:hypothetical protein SynA15127_01493 [Synechococcus sp. A15-127]
MPEVDWVTTFSDGSSRRCRHRCHLRWIRCCTDAGSILIMYTLTVIIITIGFLGLFRPIISML